MRRLALLLFVCLALPGCDPGQQALVDALQPPAISAAPVPVGSGVPGTVVLSATITPPGGALEIVRVEVRVNRDRPPGRFSLQGAPVFTVTPPPQAGPVNVLLPPDFAIVRGQLLSAQWVVDYRLRDGTDIATVTSDVVGTRLGCTDQDVTDFLNALQIAARAQQAIPQTLVGTGDIATLAARGFVPSHGFASFIGMGVAFAHTDALRPQVLIDMAAAVGLPQFTLRPHLLLYAPSPFATAAQVSEPLVPDFPYSLIGIAFAAPYNPDGPPEFGCMPHEAWFVHDAGWHRLDGGFTAESINETAPGDANPAIPTPPLFPPGDPRFGGIWHPRLWDVHLWLQDDAPPIIHVCNPGPGSPPVPDFFPRIGNAVCVGVVPAPSTGLNFPSGAFFVRGLPR
ncbi:MAG: hypothetical protein VYB54_14025 [Pseudomonadota bacterium]|nr:hypothetical protein [Pseudomonadota bacterium]